MASTEGVTKPRLVLLKRGTNGSYGFNLHGEKGVQGQFISAVDERSTAEIAGLKIGDRVVEVNGINIETATHAEVVQKIKIKPNEAELLVVDKPTDLYLKSKGIAVTRELATVESLTVHDSNHNESTQENSELEKEEVQEQETTNEDELDAVRQMEAATLESSPPDIAEPEVHDVPETPSEPEPEVEVSSAEVVASEPEAHEEEQETSVPEPEPEPVHVDNGVEEAEAEVVEKEPEIQPDEITPEEAPVPTEPESEPVSEPAVTPTPEPEPEPEPEHVPEPTPAPAPEPVPVVQQLKKPEIKKENVSRVKVKQDKKDWKSKKEMFDNL